MFLHAIYVVPPRAHFNIIKSIFGVEKENLINESQPQQFQIGFDRVL